MGNIQVTVMLARKAFRFPVLPALFIFVVTLAGQTQKMTAPVHELLVIEQDWYKDFPSLLAYNGFRPEYEVLGPVRQTCCEEGCAAHNDDRTICSCLRRELPYATYFVSRDRPDFIYRVRIRNAGSKSIKTVIWDYVFRDPQTEAELARHTFTSDTRLSPGKTKLLIARSPMPPTRVISAQMLYQANAPSPYGQRVEIKAVVFGDGSVMSY